MANNINIDPEQIQFIEKFPDDSSTLEVVAACINKFGDGGKHLSFTNWGEIVCQYLKKERIDTENSLIPSHKLLKTYNIETNSMYVFKTMFSQLTASNREGKKAPHKYIMLISIFQLIGCGIIKYNKFGSTEELEEIFIKNWKSHIPTDSPFKPNYTLPFWYLQSEPFWKLYDICGKQINSQSKKPIVSIKRQRKEITAEIDIELFKTVQNEAARLNIISYLIKYLKNSL